MTSSLPIIGSGWPFNFLVISALRAGQDDVVVEIEVLSWVVAFKGTSPGENPALEKWFQLSMALLAARAVLAPSVRST
jgi:hypothetical protein